jgi:hypothetical protein
MTSKSGNKAKSQSEKFKEAAREAGCDTSEEAFEERLRTIASSSPPDKSGTDKTKSKQEKKD